MNRRWAVRGFKAIVYISFRAKRRLILYCNASINEAHDNMLYFVQKIQSDNERTVTITTSQPLEANIEPAVETVLNEGTTVHIVNTAHSADIAESTLDVVEPTVPQVNFWEASNIWRSCVVEDYT